MTQPAWQWQGDRHELVAFAAAGQDLTDTPELEAARARIEGIDPEVFAAELGLPAGWPDMSLTAAAWAGMARLATQRRDETVRAMLAGSYSLRAVAAIVGLTHPGVRKIAAR